MRVVAQDVAIVAGAGLALIRITYQILLHRGVARHEAPLGPGGKAGATAAAQPGSLHRIDDLLAGRLVPQQPLPNLVTADGAVGGERPRALELQRLEHPQVHPVSVGCGCVHFRASRMLSSAAGVRCARKTWFNSLI